MKKEVVNLKESQEGYRRVWREEKERRNDVIIALSLHTKREFTKTTTRTKTCSVK